MGSGASSRSDAQVGALTSVQPEEPRLSRKKCKIKWDRNDMRNRKKEAAQSTAKKMSLSESHIPSIASNDSMHSLSQLGTIREELDGELALGAETDLPHCPQHDLE